MSSRRNFLKSTSGVVAACVAGGALASFLESCTSIKFVSAIEQDGKLTVNKSEFTERLFVVVKTPATPFPVYLSKINGKTPQTNTENYSALLMRCTHKQCEVKPAGTVLYCPCHGSEFSVTGKVLKEPASAHLEKFNVSHDDTNVYIHLK